MKAKFITIIFTIMVALQMQGDTTSTILGDVDGDSSVDINDVTTLIDYVLGKNPLVITVNADVNKDGFIDINDVTILIDYVLGKIDFPTEEDEEFTVNGVTFTMVYVEGGTFMMGATEEQGNDVSDRERPTHQVTLSSYRIGQTEVTQALWHAVMGENPSYFSSNGNHHPVENISWNDCQTFISALNQLTGRHFRLPTEAEWEFAARGGNESIGFKYSGSDNLVEVGWYSYNDSWEFKGTGVYGTHTVATRTCNELMLYDMSGNVHEWCNDWYANYESANQTNPTGPSTGTNKVYRGGSWYFDEWFSRVSFRNSVSPSYRSYGIGLRLAL